MGLPPRFPMPSFKLFAVQISSDLRRGSSGLPLFFDNLKDRILARVLLQAAFEVTKAIRWRRRVFKSLPLIFQKLDGLICPERHLLLCELSMDACIC